MTRRSFLTSLAVAAADSKRPNIVLILLDDAGTYDLGCYGQKHIQTPNIDRIAAEGMRFDCAYAGGAVCAPSRSVLMSGQHTGHTWIRANAGTVPLASGDRTLANLLQDAGYATGGFGKWGLGDAGSTGAPSRHGFDEFFGYLHQVHAHDYYTEFLWDKEKKYPLGGWYSADVIAERSYDFVRRNRQRPFFLYFCTTLPHTDFKVPSLEPYAAKPWTDEQKTYAAMVTRADSYVGRIMALLREYKLEKDTVVIVASDNGAPAIPGRGYEFFRSNGNLRGAKAQVYEGGIRAPLIVRWPGRVRAGSANTFPCYFADFVPTLAEITGVKPPAEIDGVSLVPVLRGGAAPAREYLYWEMQEFDPKRNDLATDRMAQAVRSGDWKVVRPRSGAPVELYNLKDDPSESRDLASQQPEVAKRLTAAMNAAHRPARPHNTGKEYVR